MRLAALAAGSVIACAAAMHPTPARAASADPYVGAYVPGTIQCEGSSDDPTHTINIWGNAPWVRAAPGLNSQLVKWTVSLYQNGFVTPNYAFYATATSNWTDVFWSWQNNRWSQLPGSPGSYYDFGTTGNTAWSAYRRMILNTVSFLRPNGTWTLPLGFWSVPDSTSDAGTDFSTNATYGYC